LDTSDGIMIVDRSVPNNDVIVLLSSVILPFQFPVLPSTAKCKVVVGFWSGIAEFIDVRNGENQSTSQLHCCVHWLVRFSRCKRPIRTHSTSRSGMRDLQRKRINKPTTQNWNFHSEWRNRDNTTGSRRHSLSCAASNTERFHIILIKSHHQLSFGFSKREDDDIRHRPKLPFSWQEHSWELFVSHLWLFVIVGCLCSSNLGSLLIVL
jgi:hypothetical protein